VASPPGAVSTAANRALARQADSLASLARVAARHNENLEAMHLFQEAIRRAPDRRAEWLPELADQTLWCWLPSDAVELYREALALDSRPQEAQRHTRLGLAMALSWDQQLEASLREYEALVQEQPTDLQAQLGRARVLSWLDRNTDAKAAYEQILAADPENFEARRELARVQSWRGKQRDAERRLLEVHALQPRDEATVHSLAQTQEWLGRPDRAAATLRSHLQDVPDDARASAMLQSLERSQRTDWRLDQVESRQSDDLAIGVTRFAADVQAHQGLTTVGPRWEYQRYRHDDTDESVHVQRPGVYVRHRFSDAVEFNGVGSVDRIDVRHIDEQHTRTTYDAWVTMWPNDPLRIDVGSSRTTLDNIQSLSRNIVAAFFNVAADFRPDERALFVGRMNWGDYTDGNARLWGQLEAERRLANSPRFLGGGRLMAFRFREVLDHGYFNPRDYVSVEATGRLLEAHRDDRRWAIEGSAGYEHASPGGDKFIWAAGVRFDGQISQRFDVGVHLAHSSSATASSGGFARTTFGARLGFR